MKTTYRSPKGKSPVWNSDWKDLSSFDLNEEPFRQVQDELDWVQSQYSKMELVIRRASKLLGDYKAGSILQGAKEAQGAGHSVLRGCQRNLIIPNVGAKGSAGAKG